MEHNGTWTTVTGRDGTTARIPTIPSLGRLALAGAHALGCRTEIRVTDLGGDRYRIEAFPASLEEPVLSMTGGPMVRDRCVAVWTAWSKAENASDGR